MTSYASQKYEEIITCDDDLTSILRKKTPFIGEDDWACVPPTVQKLLYVRDKVLKGGAGLAAPQIGLSLPIFIYTPDRTTENLRIVINPSLEPIGPSYVRGAEACFSVPLRCTHVDRWTKIKVRYQDVDRQWIEKTVEGFEAKVFQHEMDHLEGKLTLDHESADVMTFTEAHLFEDHMKQIHLEDSKTYKRKEGVG
ncbi:MAG: peptide deformylase [Proteobacteria bacterium]|nr:peptide deformylase [Pseudomonadota bacterium]